MAARTWWVLAVSVAVGVLVGIAVLVLWVEGDDDAPPDDDGEVVALIAGQTVRAEVGDRLEIRVEENPGVGDAWQVEVAPDEDVARIVDRFSEGVDTDLVGASHTEVFVLDAVGRGTTTLVLHNCFRCDDQGRTPAEDAEFAVDLTYDVRVG